MPQKQAEILLERAVSGSDEAMAQSKAKIDSRVEAWRGKLKMDKQLGELTTVALNSSDQSLRASAIEVQLAAYGLTKSESTVDAAGAAGRFLRSRAKNLGLVDSGLARKPRS